LSPPIYICDSAADFSFTFIYNFNIKQISAGSLNAHGQIANEPWYALTFFIVDHDE